MTYHQSSSTSSEENHKRGSLGSEIISGARLGRKGKNMEIKCLAFDEVLALLAHNEEGAQKC